MGNFSETQRGADADFSPGLCRLERTSSRADLVSGCDKTLRWRCFAFKSLAWSSGSQLWLPHRATWAASEIRGARLHPRPCIGISGPGSRTQSALFCKVYQVILMQSED